MPALSVRSASRETRAFLVCRVGVGLCGLPLESIVETMRALPVRSLAGVPEFVSGVAMVRGLPTPVVDASGLLFDQRAGPGGRFVSVRTAGRTAALRVDEVLGIRTLEVRSGDPGSSLLGSVRPQAIEALAAIDADLLLVLRGGCLVPERVWAAVSAAAGEERFPVTA